MAKSLIILILCLLNLLYVVQTAFVLDQRLKPRNPLAKSEIVEGDILAIQSEKDIFIKTLGIKVQSAASTVPDLNLWEYRVVPYELDFGIVERKCLIEAAMGHIMIHSCVYFRPKEEDDHHYIRIYRGDGCFASVGKYHTGNVVSIGLGCDDFGIIVHELMHVLGFHHEQSRHDRDNYLKVHYENVKNLEENKRNFDVKDESMERIFADFDYDSIMMYGPTDFGKDGKVTIESLVPGKVLGQRKGLSPLDVYSINALYQCESAYNFVCLKCARTLIHFKNCHCETRKYIDMPLLIQLCLKCESMEKILTLLELIKQQLILQNKCN